MTVFLIVIHVLVCLFLIAVVLLQSGKGAEIGAAFGGSSQTIFGSRGATSFLSKLTTISAIIFMITSLSLAVIATRGSSVVKHVPVTQEQRPMPMPPAQSGVLPAQQSPELPAKAGQPQAPGTSQAPQNTPAK